MGKTVIWSPSARGDLRSIVSYIAADNPNAAIETGQRIIDRSKQIEEFEGSGRMVPEFREKNRFENSWKVILESFSESEGTRLKS